MFQRVKPVVSISAAVFLLAAAGWALADPCPTEPTVQNFTGAGTTACPCFVSTEEAGAVFVIPIEHFPIEVLRVGIGWGSVTGGAIAQVERSLNIYNGKLPNPGAPI